MRAVRTVRAMRTMGYMGTVRIMPVSIVNHRCRHLKNQVLVLLYQYSLTAIANLCNNIATKVASK